MLVHVSIEDKVIAGILWRFRMEIIKRIVEKIIEKKEDKEGEKILHPIHRLNLLKKLIRQDEVMNGFITEKVTVTVGKVVDCKEWKDREKRIEKNIKREEKSGEVRIIETKEEIEAYTKLGFVEEVMINRPKVMFVNVKRNSEGKVEGITKINLESEMEKNL